jgi:hypothetical protein
MTLYGCGGTLFEWSPDNLLDLPATAQLALSSQGARMLDTVSSTAARRMQTAYTMAKEAKRLGLDLESFVCRPAGHAGAYGVGSLSPAQKVLAKMKKLKIDRFERIVRRLQKSLHLDNWWIDVSGEPVSHRADCEASPEYTEAKLTFNCGRIEDEDAVSFAVHELMHCHVEGLAHVAELLAGDDPFKKEMVRIEEERLTTALEKILTPLLAHIAEPVKKGKRRK